MTRPSLPLTGVGADKRQGKAAVPQKIFGTGRKEETRRQPPRPITKPLPTAQLSPPPPFTRKQPRTEEKQQGIRSEGSSIPLGLLDSMVVVTLSPPFTGSE